MLNSADMLICKKEMLVKRAARFSTAARFLNNQKNIGVFTVTYWAGYGYVHETAVKFLEKYETGFFGKDEEKNS